MLHYTSLRNTINFYTKRVICIYFFHFAIRNDGECILKSQKPPVLRAYRNKKKIYVVGFWTLSTWLMTSWRLLRPDNALLYATPYKFMKIYSTFLLNLLPFFLRERFKKKMRNVRSFLFDKLPFYTYYKFFSYFTSQDILMIFMWTHRENK